MKRLRRVAARLRNIWISIVRTPKAPPGHFYSPLTNGADRARAVEWSTRNEVPGVDIDSERMFRLASALAPYWHELDVSRRYRRDNMFELQDAAIFHSMLRHFGPSRIVEVGSGFSTAVALDTIEKHGLSTKLTCIEPHPERLKALLRPGDQLELIETLVQDVSPEVFEELNAGDFLFIDSTHVVKAGSDVVWTTLSVLPRVKAGVIVHIHDMFWPMEYPTAWITGERDWNEIYLVHAFLTDNPRWRVLLFNDLMERDWPDLAAGRFDEAAGIRPGGLWLEKIG